MSEIERHYPSIKAKNTKPTIQKKLIKKKNNIIFLKINFLNYINYFKKKFVYSLYIYYEKNM